MNDALEGAEQFMSPVLQWLRLGIESAGALWLAVGAVYALVALVLAHLRGQTASFLPIRLTFSRQHSLHFFNENLVTATRVLNESLPLFKWTLQRRLENLPNAAEVFRCYRLSVEKITHFLDGCALYRRCAIACASRRAFALMRGPSTYRA